MEMRDQPPHTPTPACAASRLAHPGTLHRAPVGQGPSGPGRLAVQSKTCFPPFSQTPDNGLFFAFSYTPPAAPHVRHRASLLRRGALVSRRAAECRSALGCARFRSVGVACQFFFCQFTHKLLRKNEVSQPTSRDSGPCWIVSDKARR